MNVFEELERLVVRYKQSGALLDTALGLVYAVGRLDRNLVGRHKRTKEFTPTEFDALALLLSRFERIVTTPNVLTEVSNLIAFGESGERRTGLFQSLGGLIPLMMENYMPSMQCSAHIEFPRLGLTDIAIAQVAAPYLVFTTDLDLYVHLQAVGVSAVNFNHLRPLLREAAE